jgi:hypothetical protein
MLSNGNENSQAKAVSFPVTALLTRIWLSDTFDFERRWRSPSTISMEIDDSYWTTGLVGVFCCRWVHAKKRRLARENDPAEIPKKPVCLFFIFL